MLFRISYIMALSLIVLSLSVAAYTIDINSDGNGNSYLTNQEGRTLYYFTNDPSDKSTCFGSCSESWPPFYVDLIDLPPTLNRHDFSYLSRPDGRYQTTYKGKPLYLYSGDNIQGERNGDGIQGLWFIARP